MTILHQRVGAEVVTRPGTAAERTQSAVMYRLGGRMYPMRTVPQCKVCQSHYRVEIERLLLRTYGYTAIWKSLPQQAQEDLSVRNITDHAKTHLPIEESIRNAVVTARAKEIGLDIDAAEEALVDHISFAKVGLQDVYERMRDGRLTPDVKDGIAFANLLLKVQEQAGEGVDNEAMFQGFMAYLAAMRAVCTPEQMREIGQRLQANPVMKALWARGERVVEGASA